MKAMFRAGLILAVVAAFQTVSVDGAQAADGQAYVDGPRLVYLAGSRAANSVTVSLSGSHFIVDDVVKITPGFGCFHTSPPDETKVSCRTTGITYANIGLGDLNDWLNYAIVPYGLINGGPGDDVMWGGVGDDSLWGDEGADTLYGWNGNDFLYGGTGPDKMYGQIGKDRVSYGESTVAVVVDFDGVNDDGGPGENDTIGSDVEDLHGSNFNDVLIGNNSANEIRGLHGSDLISGLGGDDLLLGDGFWDGFYGADYFSGGTGTDTVSYWDHTTGVVADLDGLANDDGSSGESDTIASDVENLDGSRFDDWLFGNAGPNSVNGYFGDDYLFGLDGNDFISGSTGSDRLYGGLGNDHLTGNEDADYLYGEAGTDYCDVGPGGTSVATCES